MLRYVRAAVEPSFIFLCSEAQNPIIGSLLDPFADVYNTRAYVAPATKKHSSAVCHTAVHDATDRLFVCNPQYPHSCRILPLTYSTSFFGHVDCMTDVDNQRRLCMRKLIRNYRLLF